MRFNLRMSDKVVIKLFCVKASIEFVYIVLISFANDVITTCVVIMLLHEIKVVLDIERHPGVHCQQITTSFTLA